MIDLKELEERVILAAVSTSETDMAERSLDELKELADTAGAKTVGRVIQNRESVHPGTYLGKGKLQELREMLYETGATGVICDDELSPAQLKNLEDILDTKVMDRTMVILDIFAARANTREGKIQVELAQLKYRAIRLVGMRSSLSRLGGGIGTRGPGEKKLETDRRLIHQRIGQLKKELEDVKRHREVTRQQRGKDHALTAAIVGYTNAGKSTIMNQLVSRFGVSEEKQVFEKNMLFATLDTSVRQLTLPDQKRFLLSDTVGFVSKLPTHLIEAFKSTLAEAASADLLIQVIDYSDPNYEAMMRTTEKTLKQIGIENIPMLYVFNKADQTEFEYPVMEGDNRIIISAKDDESIQLLVQALRRHLFKDYVQTELLIPFADGRTASYINENCNILETEYLNNGTRLKVEMSPQDFARFERYVIKN